MSRYFCSCSFGKDSIATALLALRTGEPLDELVYCEVMFDDAISGEVPEHRDFIYDKAIPYFEKRGIPTKVLRSIHTYVSSFTRTVSRGKAKGKINGFPLCGRCRIQRDCKIPPIRNYLNRQPEDAVQYIGIARDEQERLLRLKGKQVSLLARYGLDEQDAKTMCRREGLLSPVYEFSNRGGCWFCPNAKDRELRHLYQHHPDLWQKMLELQALPNKATEYFNRTETFTSIDERFQWMDRQLTFYQEDNDMMTRNQVERIREQYPAGTRLVLERMDDPRPIPEGTAGTVVAVDDAGQILMQWDNGRSLSLVPGVDSFRREAPKQEPAMSM